MISGSCHCGAVRFELSETPEWLTRCNCSYCARSGALWAHDEIDRISVSYAPEDIVRYIWGDKTLAFISCKICGCTTHWESLRPQRHSRMAVNCCMAKLEDVAALRIRNFDGAASWTYLD